MKSEPGWLEQNKNAAFVKSFDVSQRYNIPTLSLYLTELENIMEDPLDGVGGAVKLGPFTARINTFFMAQINSEWKIKAYSIFNHRKGDFDAELERFLKSQSF